MMSLIIDIKVIRPWNCAGSSISFMNLWTSSTSCIVVNPGKLFHSNSIGSPSMVSKVLFCGESLNQPNCSSQKKGTDKGQRKNEKAKGQGDERRCFCCDGKGHTKANCLQKVVDDKQKRDSKSSTSTDNVMPVDTGAATSCLLWFGADAPVGQEQSLRKLVGANGHALRYYGVRELDLSVAARPVRVKLVVTDVMYPVLSVETLRKQGFKVEFRQRVLRA